VLPEPYRHDAYGVRDKRYPLLKARSSLSKAWFGNSVQKPTREELEEGHHHAEEELEHEHVLGLDHAADGHQFDGRHDVEGDDLTHKH
jgi:ubiquinol-cytochrome c reductase cytochrome b subunit